MLNSEAAVCGNCRNRERYLGQFLPQADHSYRCVPCIEAERVEQRLAKQEAFQKKYNRPDVKHGQYVRLR